MTEPLFTRKIKERGAAHLVTFKLLRTPIAVS